MTFNRASGWIHNVYLIGPQSFSLMCCYNHSCLTSTSHLQLKLHVHGHVTLEINETTATHIVQPHFITHHSIYIYTLEFCSTSKVLKPPVCIFQSYHFISLQPYSLLGIKRENKFVADLPLLHLIESNVKSVCAVLYGDYCVADWMQQHGHLKVKCHVVDWATVKLCDNWFQFCFEFSTDLFSNQLL